MSVRRAIPSAANAPILRSMKKLTLAFLLAFALVPTSAAAASNGVYAKWTIKGSDLTARTRTGTIKFGVAGIPNATFKVAKHKKDTEPVELLTSTGGGDWLTGTTPFGAVFGRSGPSTKVKYLRVGEDTLDNTNRTTTKITFASAVPAGVLGIAVADLDVDKVIIRAKDASGTYLTGSQLKGTATHNTFNFCKVTRSKPTNCGNDTAVPSWLPGATGATVMGADVTSDGATAWMRPNRSIKSITMTFSGFRSVSTHSYRTWLAVPKSPSFTG